MKMQMFEQAGTAMLSAHQGQQLIARAFAAWAKPRLAGLWGLLVKTAPTHSLPR